MARNKNEELTIHGQVASSVNEYNVAMALEHFDLDYEYQYFFGLARIKGFQIIDFLVKTDPKPTPLNVQGTYWHTGRYAKEEQIKISAVNSRMRNYWAEMVHIWENECEDIDSAIEAVGTKLGVG
jgi:hypothetical protein